MNTAAVVAGSISADRIIGKLQAEAVVIDPSTGTCLIMIECAAFHGKAAIVIDAPASCGSYIEADTRVFDYDHAPIQI